MFQLWASTASSRTLMPNWVSTSEPNHGTTRPRCTLIVHVFGALAQFERRLIAERTRDGMNAARAKGSRPEQNAALPPAEPAKRPSSREHDDRARRARTNALCLLSAGHNQGRTKASSSVPGHSRHCAEPDSRATVRYSRATVLDYNRGHWKATNRAERSREIHPGRAGRRRRLAAPSRSRH